MLSGLSFFIGQVFDHIITSIAYQEGQNPSPTGSASVLNKEDNKPSF